ncbi:MAG TPA: tetratricopeptide repeat protein [Anaeromyxobacter sp.]|nr:tetratricopeptide repeat protein [Anaeromyxobacter sp.]
MEPQDDIAAAPSAAPPAAAPAAPVRPAALALAVPLALTVAAYARTLSGPLAFDDIGAIVENPAIRDLARFAAGPFRAEAQAGGRALTDLTFAVNHAIGGLAPWSYHLANLAIHLAAVVLVFLFTARVARLAGAQRSDGIALAVAGTFALHPIQTQAVSYVVQRAESLASALYLAVLLLLLEAERHPGTRRGAAAWAGAIVAFGGGLGAKAIVVTAPVAHLLVAGAVAGAPDARRELGSWRRRLALVAPLAAMGAVHSTRVFAGLTGSDAGPGVPGLPPASYLATQLRVLLTYLRLLAWPSGQNIEWDVAPVHGLSDPRAWMSALVLAALAALAVAVWRRGRTAPGPGGAAARLGGLGAAWFVLVLSPTSSVVPLADVLVEHRLYLAAWGPFLAAAAGAGRLVDRLGARGPRIALAALAALWAALAVATTLRNAVWQSSEALWRDAAAKSPHKGRIALSLGRALRLQGRIDEAIDVYEGALRRAVGDAPLQARLLNNIGTAYGQAGRLDGAIAAYQEALARAPGERIVLWNLSGALLAKGELDAAEEVARRALATDPADAIALNALAAVLLERGDAAGALPLLERGLAADPERGALWMNRGRAAAGVGREEEACHDWREAARRPLDAAARADLERMLARCGADPGALR